MSYEEMCNDVDNFAQKLGVKSAHLIGHSMGGKVAMTLALRYPEKVASLCVVDIAPVEYSATSMHVAIMDAMSKLDLETVTDMQKARHELKPAIPVRISFRKSHLSSGFHACCSELKAHAPPSEILFQKEIVVLVMTKQTIRLIDMYILATDTRTVSSLSEFFSQPSQICAWIAMNIQSLLNFGCRTP